MNLPADALSANVTLPESVVFSDFSYRCSVLRNFDDYSSKMVTFFSYFLISEAKVDCYGFRDGIIEIINDFGFIISFEEEVSNV